MLVIINLSLVTRLQMLLHEFPTLIAVIQRLSNEFSKVVTPLHMLVHNVPTVTAVFQMLVNKIPTLIIRL